MGKERLLKKAVDKGAGSQTYSWHSIEDDYLLVGALLFKLSRDIDSRIEPVLLEQGDDVSGFLDEIIKTGELVYSAD